MITATKLIILVESKYFLLLAQISFCSYCILTSFHVLTFLSKATNKSSFFVVLVIHFFKTHRFSRKQIFLLLAQLFSHIFCITHEP